MSPRLSVLMCLVVQLCLGDQPVEEVITTSKLEEEQSHDESCKHFQNMRLFYGIKYLKLKTNLKLETL